MINEFENKLSKEQLISIFFYKDKNGLVKFNGYKYNRLNENDIIRYSLDNYYVDSLSLKDTCYRLLNNIDEPNRCPTCGKIISYEKNHCNISCASKDPNVQEKLHKTNLEKYGVTTSWNNKKQQETMINKYGVKSALCKSKLRDKGIQTKIQKYGSSTYNNPDQTTKTCIEKYGTGRNYNQIEKTMLDKYGITSYLKSKQINEIRNNTEIQNKIQLTKRINHTFNTSKLETESYKLLKEKYTDIIRQYKSEVYPFVCDFYIPSLDLYIECNYHWTHGNKPYTGTKEDNLIVENWKNKNTKFYNNAINTWTIRDVNKRMIAIENNLNYKEFWSIKELQDWMKLYKKNKSIYNR